VHGKARDERLADIPKFRTHATLLAAQPIKGGRYYVAARGNTAALQVSSDGLELANEGRSPTQG
jgi:hypothetical protein